MQRFYLNAGAIFMSEADVGNAYHILCDAAEVDAALAAKDARIAELEKALRMEQGMRLIETTVDAVMRPDAARLDKLPALRDLVDRVWNEATESKQVPHTEWADRIIKTWIDAHQEPKP